MNDMSNFTLELPAHTENGRDDSVMPVNNGFPLALNEAVEVKGKTAITVAFQHSTRWPDDDSSVQHFVTINVSAPATLYRDFFKGPFDTKAEAAAAMAEVTVDSSMVFPAKLELGSTAGSYGALAKHFIGVRWRDGDASHLHWLLSPFHTVAEAKEMALKLMAERREEVQELAS